MVANQAERVKDVKLLCVYDTAFVRLIDGYLVLENVDKRRASIGLPSLEDYLKNFEMTWDLKQYKKDLPLIEKLQRKCL